MPNTDLVTKNPLTTIPYTNNDDVTNEIAVTDKEGRLTVRAGIDNYEEALKKLIGSDIGDKDVINEDGLKEYFAGGAYIRELFIPKDCTIVSKIWNKERMWIIATGEVTFVTEMGIRRVKAPYREVVSPGSKVALYTHEDTLWFAITGTDATNSEEVEEDVIAPSYNACTYPWDELENKSGDTS